MKALKYFIVIFIFLAITNRANCQFLETRQIVDVIAGPATLSGNENNMFFPSSLSYSGMNFNVAYGYKIKPRLEAGLAVGYLNFTSSDGDAGFAQVQASGASVFSVGPQVVVHSPFSETGMFNRFRFALAITPQYQYYSGERSLLIDNEVVPNNGSSNVASTVEMNPSSSGFGARLSPEVYCRFTQRVGLKIAYNAQYCNFESGYGGESLLSHSMLVGLMVTFGNYKQLFL